MSFPILDDVVTEKDVSNKGTGRFSASYVNWAKVSHLLRKNAPGWESFYVPAADGGMCHAAPDGTYFLLIGFEKWDNEEKRPVRTQPVPHAVMDHKMGAKSTVSARDISDAYVRGMCKAAALRFGLGWRLWSKDDPFERDEQPTPPPRKVAAKPAATKPAPKAATFASKGAALKGLAQVQTAEALARWASVMRDSGFSGEDREELVERYRGTLNIIESKAKVAS